MEYLRLLPQGKNELDVVGTFNNSYPKIVMKVGEQENYIPYDGVAFMVEIKTTINKDTLTSDLEKFEIINHLPLSQDRLGGAIAGGDYTTEKPIRILLYFESQIDNNIMHSLLQEQYSAWDIVFIQRNFYIRLTGYSSNVERYANLVMMSNKEFINFGDDRISY
jgi:hypothetical protein